MHGSTYRPALDGLRAVAVAAVIAYHLGLPVPGGFLGVDLFFVLSGYLITSLLLTEHASTGRIAFGAFWARRARRLIPAVLVLVVACSLAAAQGPLLDLDARRDDMISTLLYYANWHFIHVDESYFAGYNGASPLRHMWSLAIEEQFYVVWPILVALLVRVIRHRWYLGAILIAAAAVASAVHLVSRYDALDPSRAYMGTDTRAYQLLIGALLAILIRRRPQLSALIGLVVGLAGTSGVLLCLLTFSDRAGFYYEGGGASFAILAAGVIAVVELAPRAFVTRVLGTRVLAATGRISYGLYLWHWPLVVWLLDASRINNLGLGQRQLLVITATLIAAGLSYVLIERPVRTGRIPWLRHSGRRLLLATPISLAVIGLLAVQSTASPSLPLARQIDDQSVDVCPDQRDWCIRTEAVANRPTVATVGDSTALALDPGLREVTAARGWGYVQGGRNGCSFAPVAVQDRTAPDAAQLCASSALSVLDGIARETHPDVWLISDRLLLFPLHRDGRVLAVGDPSRDAAVARAVKEAIAHLLRTGAVVILETPPMGEAVECALNEQHDSCGAQDRSTADPPTRWLNALYRSIARELPGRVFFVQVADLICDQNGRCPAAVGDTLMRYDGIHFTRGFSQQIVPTLVQRAQASGAVPSG